MIFGGEIESNCSGYQLIYTFDTQKLTWKPFTTNGIQPPRKESISPIINSFEKLFSFGGWMAPETGAAQAQYLYLDILDIIGLNWSNDSLLNAPTARGGYASILLPNDTILYLGGWSFGLTIELNASINDVVPEGRGHFTAVFGLNKDRLIIYGGECSVPSIHDAQPSLAVLNLSSKPFAWISQK
ncbi:1782_t:CDS:2, partial [Dentiscutata erythropus]